MTQARESLTADNQGPEPVAEPDPLVLMGNPVLRAVAAPVETGEFDLAALGDEMVEIMHRSVGVGLAAPQIGLSKRVIVYEIPPSRQSAEDPPAPRGPQVLVNPELEPVGDEMLDGLEGCLSIPGLRGIVPRHATVRYHGIGPDGQAVEGVAEGFHARVLQHEVDHLDGVLYLDRMKSLRLLAFESEAHHLGDMIA